MRNKTPGEYLKWGNQRTYGETGDYAGIIAAIVNEVEDRTRKDIQDWRMALTAASDPDNPRWTLLQDLYETLSTDGHFVSQVRIRKAAVLSRKFIIRDSRTGKEDKDKTKLLQKRWVFLMISELLENIIRGYTVLQIPEAGRIMKMNPLEDKFFTLPRRNFIPQLNFMLFKVNEDKGVYITDPAFDNTIVCIKNPDKFGVMNSIIPDLIWKRNARQGWAIFSERFGIPLVKITSNKTSKKDIDALELMAKKMGQAARAVIPNGSTMDIIDSATKGDPYKVFLEQINLGNDEISKAILGGTMISDNGASRSQSEVMERTLDEKLTEMDLVDTELTITDQVLPILRAGGFPFTEHDEFVYDRSISISLTAHWNITQGIIQTGYEVDTQWIAEKFNVPITGKAKKKPTAPAVEDDPDEEDTEDDPENFKKPSKAKAPAALGGAAWPDYTTSGCCPKCGKMKFTAAGNSAAFQKLLDQLEEDIVSGVWDNKDVTPDQVRKGIAVGKEYRAGLMEGWGERNLQLAYDAPDHHAIAAMEMNLFTFTQLREKASVLELNRLLIDKDGNRIRTFEEFKELAKPHLANMNTKWLETEYNFAIATGQGASRYHQFLSEADTITQFLEYLTAGDNRVRHKHQLLNGRKFSIYDTEARRIWPPNDWGCRCEFLQYIGDVSKATLTTGKEGQELLGWTDKQKKLFGVNRGEIGQVFLNNQYYVADTGLAKDIAGMTYDKYGLRSWEDMKDSLPGINLDKSITTGNVGELFTPVEGKDYMGFKDYLNRAITLDKKVFDEHTQAARYTTGEERRHQLFPKVQEALDKPDEVYLHSYKKGVYQFKYVKMYKETMLIVPVRLGKQNLEVTTWYELKAKEKMQRVGLLIHKQDKP